MGTWVHLLSPHGLDGSGGGIAPLAPSSLGNTIGRVERRCSGTDWRPSWHQLVLPWRQWKFAFVSLSSLSFPQIKSISILSFTGPLCSVRSLVISQLIRQTNQLSFSISLFFSHQTNVFPQHLNSMSIQQKTNFVSEY